MNKLIFSSIVILSLTACGGGTSTSPAASVKTNAYQGAGSTWSLSSSDDGTCTLFESGSNLKADATCSKLASGFTKVTVNSATGGNLNLSAPTAGTVTYALEVDGYMMPFIAFTENKVVPTVSTGTCSSSLNHNFVVSFAKLGLNADFTGWATMGNYTLTNGTLSLNRYKADGTFLNTPSLSMSTTGCFNGLLETTTSGDLTRFYFTQNGGAIFYRDSSNSVPVTNGGSTENNFMLPTTNDVSSLASLDGGYIGFVTTSQGNGNYNTTPVSVAATNGTLTLTARSGTDLVTQIANHSSITLNSIKVAASLYRGSLTHTNPGGSIGCAINANISNQKIVICSGLDPADTTNKTLYSAILRSI